MQISRNFVTNTSRKRPMVEVRCLAFKSNKTIGLVFEDREAYAYTTKRLEMTCDEAKDVVKQLQRMIDAATCLEPF